METRPALIEFQRVVAGYSPTLTILNELSLEARAGEITLLIGPNGAGKSTALKALFGLLAPRAGEIRLEGRRVSGTAPRGMIDRGLAFVPQGRNLFPSLSVLHNLELGGITLPGRKLLRERIEGILDLFPRVRGLDALGRRAEAARDRSRAPAQAARPPDRRALDRARAEDQPGGVPAAAPARGRGHDGADGGAECAQRAQVRGPRAGARDGAARTGPSRGRASRRSGSE